MEKRFRILILILNMFIFILTYGCGQGQTGLVKITPPSLNTMQCLLVFQSHAITPEMDVESYAEVYLDKKKIGVTEQKLLSQPKTFIFETSNQKKHLLKFKIHVQDPYRKNWRTLRKNQLPPEYIIPPLEQNKIKILLNYDPANFDDLYVFEIITIIDKPYQEKKIKVLLSLKSFIQTPFLKNLESYAEVYLDKKMIGETERKPFSEPKIFEFETTSERHLLRLVIYLWDKDKKEWKRLKNIGQPPPRYFLPDKNNNEKQILSIYYFPKKNTNPYQFQGNFE